MADYRKSAETILNITKSTHIEVDFTDEEKERLTTHMMNKDLNQFYTIVVLKVLEQKTFTVSKEKVTPFLISNLADNKVKVDDLTNKKAIVDFAELTYKTLYLIDIEAIYKSKF